MARPIIVDGAERVACPKCNHGFALSEGISRQAIERYADEFERGLAEQRRKLEAELAAEAKRRAEREFETRMKAMQESAAAQEAALAKFRAEELNLRYEQARAHDGIARTLRGDGAEADADESESDAARTHRDRARVLYAELRLVTG